MRKSIKKWTYLYLVLTFCILLCFSLGVSAATVTTQRKTIKTTTKKITMVKGEKLHIFIKGYNGPITWQSNKRNILTINEYNILQAKKKGTAILKGTYGKKTIKLKVNVQAPRLNITNTTIQLGKKKQLRLIGTNQDVNVNFPKSRTNSFIY